MIATLSSSLLPHGSLITMIIGKKRPYAVQRTCTWKTNGQAASPRLNSDKTFEIECILSLDFVSVYLLFRIVSSILFNKTEN